MQLVKYTPKTIDYKLAVIVGSMVSGFFIGYIISGEYSYFASLLTILLIIIAFYIRAWHINVMTGEIMLIEETIKANSEFTATEQKRIESQMKAEQRMIRQEERQLSKLNKNNDSLENIFDPSSLSILHPIIKQAKKENRKVHGQELIQVILKGMR